jgi:anti-sigma-K factor RskA
VTCEEFQDLAGALVLGALDQAERAAAEEHLLEREHRGCPEALARATNTAAALAGALPQVAPGEGVWRAIEARIGLDPRMTSFKEGGSAEASSSARRAPRRATRALAWGAAAAAAVALLALWGRERSARERSEAELAAVERGAQAEARERAALLAEVRTLREGAGRERDLVALLDAPDSQLVPLGPVEGHSGRASAVVNVRARRAVVVSTALAPEAGKDYQLWVIHGTGAPEPAGFLRFSHGAVAVGEIDPELLAVPPGALAVSLEPAGGGDKPTDVVLLGKLPG